MSYILEEKEKNYNFEPLTDYLAAYGGPTQMAGYVEMLLFEHMWLILLLIELGVSLEKMDIKCETAEIIHELHILIGQLELCEELVDD